jgi:hypothetical protein
VSAGIVEWGSGRWKDLGDCAPTKCPRCKNVVFLRNVRTMGWFRLYLVIPILPVRVTYYVICPMCEMALKLDYVAQAKASRAVKATAAYRAGAMPRDEYERVLQDFWAASQGEAQHPDWLFIDEATRPSIPQPPPAIP